MQPNPQQQPDAVNEVVQRVVDDIWAQYDKDNNGFLDKEEAKSFVIKTLADLGGDNQFSDEAYEETFGVFDKDGSGTISRGEMVSFIKEVAGI